MSHSRQTEHYELPLYDGTDIINPLTDFNNANETIDEAVYNANQRSVGAETTAQEAKDIAQGYDARVAQAIETANNAMTLANNTQDMIAEDFNPTKEGGYKVGDFVIYNGVLYKFINAHTGAWDASDVQASPVLIEAIKDVVEEGKQAINEAVEEAEEEIAGQTEKVTKTQAMIAQPFDENKVDGYAVDAIVTYADKLYKFTSAHSGSWTGLDVEQVDVIETVNEKTDDLRDELNYKYLGNTTGTASLALPDRFRELYIEVGDPNGQNRWCYNIPFYTLTTNAKNYLAGSYYGSDYHTSCSVAVSKTSIALNALISNGTNLTNTGVTGVYYR